MFWQDIFRGIKQHAQWCSRMVSVLKFGRFSYMMKERKFDQKSQARANVINLTFFEIWKYFFLDKMVLTLEYLSLFESFHAGATDLEVMCGYGSNRNETTLPLNFWPKWSGWRLQVVARRAATSKWHCRSEIGAPHRPQPLHVLSERRLVELSA